MLDELDQVRELTVRDDFCFRSCSDNILLLLFRIWFAFLCKSVTFRWSSEDRIVSLMSLLMSSTAGTSAFFTRFGGMFVDLKFKNFDPAQTCHVSNYNSQKMHAPKAWERRFVIENNVHYWVWVRRIQFVLDSRGNFREFSGWRLCRRCTSTSESIFRWNVDLTLVRCQAITTRVGSLIFDNFCTEFISTCQKRRCR